MSAVFETVVVVGAQGLVGVELQRLMAREPIALAPKLVRVSRNPKPGSGEVQLGELRFTRDSLAFFCTDAETSRREVPKALAAGARVIDFSTAFRSDPEVPLVVPELPQPPWQKAQLIANPNCAAILLCTALSPLQRAFGLDEVVVSTYQAASGAGAQGLMELEQSAEAARLGKPFAPVRFPAPLAFNLFPHESALDPASGLCDEEEKLGFETRRLLAEPELPIAPTCVRVATRRAHALAVVIRLHKDPTVSELAQVLGAAPGLALVPPDQTLHPEGASGLDEVFVGRLRRYGPNRFGLFVVSDQLRKGAALNALQIANSLELQG